MKADVAGEPVERQDDAQVKREEFRSFLLFTVVMAPVLAVVIVSA